MMSLIGVTISRPLRHRTTDRATTPPVTADASRNDLRPTPRFLCTTCADAHVGSAVLSAAPAAALRGKPVDEHRGEHSAFALCVERRHADDRIGEIGVEQLGPHAT